jgi:hypothetical protein
LSDEIDRCLQDGLFVPESAIVFENVEVRYLPMMCERTPISRSLLYAFADRAAQLLDRPVLPMRAKGSRYFGDTTWHSDSSLDVPSIGFVAYLEPLDASTGALRVRPGSHLRNDEAHSSERVVATKPGDVIVFDEHLEHGSLGGGVRRQWRVDYVADPATEEEFSQVRSYFARIYEVGWDGGYDVDRYPNYDAHWHMNSPYRARLEELGALDRAHAHEDFVRRRRRS